MSTSISPTDLIKFHSGPKISDFKNWKPAPVSAIVEQTPEMKAELAASEAHAEKLKAKSDAARAANPIFNNPAGEANTMYMTNVATLAASDIKPRIEYITNLIQSGEANNYTFQSGDGEQTTSSIHQYLSWLLQRAQELDDGTYSPAMFK